MNIVNFTPYSALTGGIIIGFAVAIFFYFNGRLVGISGIASNALTEERNKLDNILFLIGLIIGPIIYTLFNQEQISISISNSYLPQWHVRPWSRPLQPHGLAHGSHI